MVSLRDEGDFQSAKESESEREGKKKKREYMDSSLLKPVSEESVFHVRIQGNTRVSQRPCGRRQTKDQTDF